MLTDAQKALRKNGIGASETAMIMGFSNYKTPYMLWCEKLGMLDAEEEMTEQQEWGHRIEPVIRAKYSEIHGVDVVVPDTLFHPERPYMFAHLDGYVAATHSVMEAKNVSEFAKQEWGIEGTDKIPMAYLIQVAHQCIVTEEVYGRCDYGDVACLIGGNKYKEYRYERDAELEQFILTAIDTFWTERIIPRVEPESITIEDTRHKYRETKPEATVCCTTDISAALSSLNAVKDRMKQLARDEEKYKIQVMEFMKHNEYLINDSGQVVVTCKPNARGSRVFLLK